MIILALLNVVYLLFSLLLAPVNIPSLPDSIPQHLENCATLISDGLSILANFVYLDYLLILFGVVVLVDVGVLAYKLVMFFLRKIPMLGIE